LPLSDHGEFGNQRPSPAVQEVEDRPNVLVMLPPGLAKLATMPVPTGSFAVARRGASHLQAIALAVAGTA
jgi:hypothetical protein